MKERKSLKSIILALILCCTMLPLSGITVFAEGTATLAALSVGGNVIDLTGETEYTVKVPVTYSGGVDVFTVPQVKATAAEGCSIVSITKPVVSGNTATATVVVSDGAADTTYTINMELIGVNQIYNGGYELDETKIRTAPLMAGAPGRASNYAYQGSYGIRSGFSHSGYNKETFTADVAKNNWSKVTKDKKYLFSAAVRPETDSSIFMGFVIEKYTGEEDNYPDLTDGYELEGEFYLDNAKKNDENADLKVMRSPWAYLNANWHVYNAVFSTTADMNINARFDSAASVSNFASEDSFFLGELVIADIDVKADGSEVPAVIDSNEDAELNFTGNVKNQLGNTNGVADRTNLAFSLVNAPEGVVINDGTLTVPKGTSGKFIVRATATPDAEVWTEASQDSFVEDYEITVSSKTYEALSSVKIGDTPVALNEATNVYNIKAPVKYVDGGVENYVVPALNVAAKDPAHEVVVEEGTPVNNKVTTTVTVKENGSVLETYTFNIEYIGVNQLQNGGFESGANTIRYAPAITGTGTWGRSTEAASTGSYGIKTLTHYVADYRSYFTDAAVNAGQTTVQPGKTYLYSTDYRLPDARNQESNEFQQVIKDANAESQAVLRGTFYNGSKDISSIDNNGPQLKCSNFYITKNWTTLSCLFTTDSEVRLQSYLSDSTGAGDVYEDNFFLGELVIGDILLNEDAAAELEVSTAETDRMPLAVKAVNQIGSTSGVDSTKVDVALSLVGAPAGVTLNQGVLTFEEGATGEVVVRATATPTASWSDCQQESFVKEFTISLVGKDGFTVENNEYSLRYTNDTDSLVNATVIKAVYTANGNGLKLESVVCEAPVSVAAGNVLTKSGNVPAENGKIVKLFLCNMENLQPLVINYAE